jgi:hypothetical protein
VVRLLTWTQLEEPELISLPYNLNLLVVFFAVFVLLSFCFVLSVGIFCWSLFAFSSFFCRYLVCPSIYRFELSLWCLGIFLWGYLLVLSYTRWLDILLFNATYSNITAISWRPVLVVEEAGVTGEKHLPWTSNWQTLSLAPVSRMHPFL